MDGGHETVLTQEDRDAAVSVLRARLPGSVLRAIATSLQPTSRNRKSVEWLVAETENYGDARVRSRLPDSELADLLIDLKGLDLFAEREVRYRLAVNASDAVLEALHEYPSQNRGRGGRESKARAVADRNWHCGKSWARHFVTELGFPAVFAGVAGSPAEANLIEVEPFEPLPDLADFQRELLLETLKVLRGPSGKNRAILTLPTGAGKTRTAVESLVEWRLSKKSRPAILWVAQSDELCEQAVQAFREVWIDLGHRRQTRESLIVHRLWGTDREIPSAPGVVVASIQKLHAIYRGQDGGTTERDERRKELKSMAEVLGAVVIDEAHRMLAPIYTEVLRFLGVEVARSARAAIPLLGLTATPFRSQDEETERLVTRFHRQLLRPTTLGRDPEQTLRKRGILSNPEHKVLRYDGRTYVLEDSPRFVDYHEQYNEIHPELLRQLGQERERNHLILEAMKELPKSWPTLLFACSVEHAQAMTVLLRRMGRTAATVAATTRYATRRFLIEEFREGRVSVLCNYGVLTTGFDAPQVRAVVIARPTGSSLLYQQMIGRGMRGPKFGGTERCLIIDVEDNIQFRGRSAYRRYEEFWDQKRSDSR